MAPKEGETEKGFLKSVSFYPSLPKANLLTRASTYKYPAYNRQQHPTSRTELISEEDLYYKRISSQAGQREPHLLIVLAKGFRQVLRRWYLLSATMRVVRLAIPSGGQAGG
jgi:hypothetical protein